jgi:hypothetical protein
MLQLSEAVSFNRKASMFPRCANPECQESFSSFREGTFSRFRRTDSEAASSSGKHHAVEHAWLCARCSEHYTADYIENKIALVSIAPVMPVVEEVLPSAVPMRARARAMRRRRPSARRSSAQPPAANPMIVLAINPRGEFD